MKKFSLITILTAKTPDLFWGVVKFLKEEAKELGEEVRTDGKNYICLETGSPVLFVAHMDTCNKDGNGPVELYVNDKGFIQNKHGILGADDRAGVFGILEIYRRAKETAGVGDKLPSLLFTNFEESGGTGVKVFTAKEKLKYHDNYKLFIELDRKGKDHYVTYNGGLPAPLKAYLIGKQLKEETGSYSDICDLTKHFKIPSINIACGYLNQHHAEEILDLPTLEKCIKKCIEMFKDDAMPKCIIPEVVKTQTPGVSAHTAGAGAVTNHNRSGFNYGNQSAGTAAGIPTCPQCQHTFVTRIENKYDAAKSCFMDKFECVCCTHQWSQPALAAKSRITTDVAKVDVVEGGIWFPSVSTCQACNKSLFDKTHSWKEGKKETTFTCASCCRSVAAVYLTAKSESICPTCTANSMVMFDNYQIQGSNKKQVQLKCGLCGHTRMRKVTPEEFNVLYKNFNEKVKNDIEAGATKKQQRCECGSLVSFVNNVGVSICFSCKKTTIGGVGSKTEVEKVSKIPINKIDELVKISADALKKSIVHDDWKHNREAVISTLKTTCGLCGNHANCVKASAEYANKYHADVCPVIKAGDFTISGIELFIEASIPSGQA